MIKIKVSAYDDGEFLTELNYASFEDFSEMFSYWFISLKDKDLQNKIETLYTNFVDEELEREYDLRIDDYHICSASDFLRHVAEEFESFVSDYIDEQISEAENAFKKTTATFYQDSVLEYDIIEGSIIELKNKMESDKSEHNLKAYNAILDTLANQIIEDSESEYSEKLFDLIKKTLSEKSEKIQSFKTNLERTDFKVSNDLINSVLNAVKQETIYKALVMAITLRLDGDK
jgi:hypothetical protein